MRKPSGLLRTIFHQGAMGAWSDGQLLERFTTGGQGKEVALEVLIERYGPMVLGICRRALDDPHDVEDAFQSTFLALVRKADGLRDRDLVGHWLYGVASRVAAKTRAEGRRRAQAPAPVDPAAPEASTDPELGERLAALDEEIGRLPEKYRLPLVLCYMQGLRHQEVAQRLGCPVGTVESRLSRGRDRLRDRLTRRGLAPALALLSEPSRSSPAAVPPSLVGATVRAADVALGSARAVGRWSPLALAASRPSLLGFLALGVATAVMGGIALEAGPWLRVAGRLRAAKPDPPITHDSPMGEAQRVNPAPGATPVRPDMPTRPTRPTPPIKPGRDPSAVALPLRGITIDGDLEDWPAAVPRHLLRRILAEGQLGFGGLKGADLSASPDLSAAFSVGYDPEEQLIYLAVIVRDDRLIVGNASHLDTDAVEVYIDGLHGARKIPQPRTPFWEHIDLSALPVQQYVAIPGPGTVYGTNYDTNPALLAGELARTRTRMAYRRAGDVTTYEWAIQPFDRYPDRPTQLGPGKRLGFDLAVADKDVPATSPRGMSEPEQDRAAWIYWGPQWSGMKALDAGNLGELILGTGP